MGARGPVPNRSEDLNRPRERKGTDQTGVTKGVAIEPVIPEADENWHPIATLLWEAALNSGQKDFYQQTDWVALYSLCEELSVYKSAGYLKDDGTFIVRRNGQILTAINSMMSSLLIMEGDRRRVRIELDFEHEEIKPASVAILDDYRAGLGVAPEAE